MAIFNALLNLRELKELYSENPVGICPLYKGSIGVSKRIEAAGNPVIVPKYVILEKLNIEFLPKQAGTGDPSPENVRPISGRDSVQVTQSGRNLYNADELIEIKGDQKNYGYGVPADNLVIGKTYTLSANTPVFSFKISDSKNSYNSVNANNVTNGKITFVMARNNNIPNEKTQFVMVASTSSFTGKDLVATPEQAKSLQISICAGDKAMPYEPYQPGTTATLALPETIYGGTVDAVTGVGSKTWGYIASYNGESLPGEWISDRDVYSAGTTPTTGAQVAYKLATPEPFKVSQVSIPSLRGENYFFTNGENMDIIYKKEYFWSDES